MELSGSIQVWSNNDGMIDVLRDNAALAAYYFVGSGVTPQKAVALFTAEVLRMKEAPHGTDAE